MAETRTTDLERVIQARDFVALHEMLKHWSPGTAASLIEPLHIVPGLRHAQLEPVLARQRPFSCRQNTCGAGDPKDRDKSSWEILTRLQLWF